MAQTHVSSAAAAQQETGSFLSSDILAKPATKYSLSPASCMIFMEKVINEGILKDVFLQLIPKQTW